MADLVLADGFAFEDLYTVEGLSARWTTRNNPPC
jgi:hypothetical protein